MTTIAVTDTSPGSDAPARSRRTGGTLLPLLARRIAAGVFTLFAVSVIVFAATQVLPGNAATAVLGQSGTPQRVAQLEAQMHLDRPAVAQYLSWIGGILHGNPGTSLVANQSVASIVLPRVLASTALVLLAAIIGIAIGVVGGVLAAARRDGVLDQAMSLGSLIITALPEFVVALLLVVAFSTTILRVLPAVSIIAPGQSVLDSPSQLVLPIATLVIVTVPYIFRMMRGTMLEALESDYVEMARLKGVRVRRILFVHALPNALAPVIQVIGLTLLYLAGGIVVVEFVFNYRGLGQGLVNAVTTRDIPTIQFLVLLLAAFYVVVNIGTDVLVLLVSPRRRYPR
jgi:peptide/nickel transport system permease protein